MIRVSTDLAYKARIKSRRVKWAEELTGGKYAQGKGTLYDRLKDKYCCLGVACEVFSETENFKINSSDYGRRSVAYHIDDDDMGNTLCLPEELRKYLGLSLADQSVLIGLNDSGVSFKQIAQAILAMEIFEEE